MKKISFLEKLLGKGTEEEDPGSRQHIDKEGMIRGIDGLAETSVKEVMVPRIDVVFVQDDDSFDQLIQTLVDCGHSRVPVYRESIDDVIGFLYVKDLLKFLQSGQSKESFKLADIIRKAYFVPESKKLDSMMREFQGRKVHIAVAVDEYGGISGVVCLEDIIEEIVGDIQDEFDNEVEDILDIGPGAYLCDARVSIEDLNEAIGTDLSSADYDTLGGFVFNLFGKIPVRYEKVDYDGIEYVVQEMDGHKIEKVKIVTQEEDEKN